LQDTVPGWFHVDLQPPVVLGFTPPEWDISNDSSRIIHVEFIDSIAGVDSNTVLLYVQGHPLRPGCRESPGPPDRGSTRGTRSSSWSTTRLAAGIHWTDNDSVHWCLEAADSPDLCDSNFTNPCHDFFVHTSGPVEVIAWPWDSAITACADQAIRITITILSWWTGPAST